MESRAEAALRRLTVGVRRALRPLGRRAEPALRAWRRIPLELRIGGAVLVLVIGGFFAAVVPLLTSGGRNVRAEVSGHIPETVSAGEEWTLPVAIDNTSVAVISPLCVVATIQPAGVVRPETAGFQGLETVPFTGERVCGGSLSGEEVITVILRLRPLTTGTATVTLTAAEGGHLIGPALRGTVHVVAP